MRAFGGDKSFLTAARNRDFGNFLSFWPESATWHGGAILQPAALH